MRVRFTIYLIVVLAVFALFLYWQWRLDLGPFAESPQSFSLRPGERRIVAGGGGVLRLLEIREAAPRGVATSRQRKGILLLRCGGEVEETVELGADESTEEHCGLWIRLRELEADEARLEVWWD